MAVRKKSIFSGMIALLVLVGIASYGNEGGEMKTKIKEKIRTSIKNGATDYAFSATSTEPLSLYKNSEYHFILKYPSNLSTDTTFQPYYILSNTWRVNAIEGSTGKPVVSIPVIRIDQGGVATEKSYPLYFDAEVRVGVDASIKGVQDCYKKDDIGYMDQKADVVINGIPFKKFTFDNSGMNQYLRGVSYRTIHRNMCYAIEAIKTGSSYRDDTMTSGMSDSELDAYFLKVESIIKTFRFTNK